MIGHRLRRPRVRDVAVLSGVVLVGVEVVAGRDYLVRSVRALSHVGLGWVVLAVLAAVASMAYFARTQRRMLHAAGTDVSTLQMLRLAFEANAISVTLPGGTVLSVAYASRRLRRFGATPAATGFTLVASALLSTATFWALALVYAGLANGRGGWIVPLAGVAGVAVVVGLARYRPTLLARSIQALARATATLVGRRRPRAQRALQDFFDGLLTVRPRAADWAIATAFAELNWLTDLLCFVACCAAIADVGISPAVVLAAYLAGMTASSVSVLPGGFGVVEGAMILALTAGGVPAVVAVPSVLLYRLISCVLVVATGWVAWLVSSTTSHAAGPRRRDEWRVVPMGGAKSHTTQAIPAPLIESPAPPPSRSITSRAAGSRSGGQHATDQNARHGVGALGAQGSSETLRTSPGPWSAR